MLLIEYLLGELSVERRVGRAQLHQSNELLYNRSLYFLLYLVQGVIMAVDIPTFF